MDPDFFTDSGALMTPVLYPNCSMPRTAAKMLYPRQKVSPWSASLAFLLSPSASRRSKESRMSSISSFTNCTYARYGQYHNLFCLALSWKIISLTGKSVTLHSECFYFVSINVFAMSLVFYYVDNGHCQL